MPVERSKYSRVAHLEAGRNIVVESFDILKNLFLRHMVPGKEPLDLLRRSVTVLVPLANRQSGNVLPRRSRHLDHLEDSRLAVAHINFLRDNFRNVVVCHLIHLGAATSDFQGNLFEKIGEELRRQLHPPSRCRDESRLIRWILIQQNFIELAQPAVLPPWLVPRIAAAATETVQESVWPPLLVPIILGRDKPASATQKQFLLLAARTEV